MSPKVHRFQWKTSWGCWTHESKERIPMDRTRGKGKWRASFSCKDLPVPYTNFQHPSPEQGPANPAKSSAGKVARDQQMHFPSVLWSKAHCSPCKRIPIDFNWCWIRLWSRHSNSSLQNGNAHAPTDYAVLALFAWKSQGSCTSTVDGGTGGRMRGASKVHSSFIP